MDLTTELKKEYRRPESWAAQIGHIFHALIYGLGVWLQLACLLFGLQLMGLVLFSDWVPADYGELRQAFKDLAVVAMFASGTGTGVFILVSKLRNVFADTAEQRAERHNQAKRETESQIETIDRALLTYRLITEEQIWNRKNNAENAQHPE